MRLKLLEPRYYEGNVKRGCISTRLISRICIKKTTSEINHAGNQTNQPNHSVLSLNVRILEKKYHVTNSPQLSTPRGKKRE